MRDLQAVRRLQDAFCFVLVAGYLTGVLFFLLVTKRLDPNISLVQILKALILRRRPGKLKPEKLKGISHQNGHCYVAPISGSFISDREGGSRIMVYENGKPLPKPHAMHDTIRKEGRGTFSHWGELIYFSSSDNSDPRTNNRTYTIAEL